MATKALKHILSRHSGKISQRFKYQYYSLSEALVTWCLSGKKGISDWTQTFKKSKLVMT